MRLFKDSSDQSDKSMYGANSNVSCFPFSVIRLAPKLLGNWDKYDAALMALVCHPEVCL